MAKAKRTPEQQEQYDAMTARLAKLGSIGEVAKIIFAYWPNMYYGAVPYAEAMAEGLTFNLYEPYRFETQRPMVLYFLANAQTWKGPVAQAVKDFLNKRYGYK